MRPLPSRVLAYALAVEGSFVTISTTFFDTTSVCSRVVPGTISIPMLLKSEFSFGKNCVGIIASSATVISNEPKPTPTIQTR